MRTWVGRLGASAMLTGRKAETAGGGLGVDIGLYLLSAVFAAVTAVASTLPAHRAWAAIAAAGYGAATVAASGQFALRALGRTRWAYGPGARAGLAVGTWVTVALVPLLTQAVQRAAGQLGRAQEEVPVIEDGGARLLDTATPYLDRASIAALPEPLLGYLPYQPGMAIFGIPRALDDGAHWWSDARVWFALVTAGVIGLAVVLLRRGGAAPTALVRGLQIATVLPVCALTLATGGDDLPVLSLCLLAIALAALDRPGWAGVAIGLAAALKLFAWPVAIALGALALTQRRARVYVAGALGIPVLTAIPALLVDRAALVENMFAFPLGRGLVSSPAASPLPGHLIAASVPGGRAIATGLLLLAGAGIAVVLVRHPPRTAAAAALISGVGLLAAMLLMPATRFGYLLYPVALLVWASAVRLPDLAESSARPADLLSVNPGRLPSTI